MTVTSSIQSRTLTDLQYALAYTQILVAFAAHTTHRLTGRALWKQLWGFPPQ